MKHNKIILSLLVIFIVLSLSGCTETNAYDSTPYKQPTNKYDTNRLLEISEEYGKHLETLESDWDKLYYISDEFTSYDEYVVKKNDVTITDIYKMTDILKEYVYEYRIVHSHLESFNNFIIINEDELKYMDVDTFTALQNINDFDIQLQNMIDMMGSRIQYYIDYIELKEQYNQQKQEELAELIKILTLLI
jgi:hypothetical protein